jgi:hypothetical protein
VGREEGENRIKRHSCVVLAAAKVIADSNDIKSFILAYILLPWRNVKFKTEFKTV